MSPRVVPSSRRWTKGRNNRWNSIVPRRTALRSRAKSLKSWNSFEQEILDNRFLREVYTRHRRGRAILHSFNVPKTRPVLLSISSTWRSVSGTISANDRGNSRSAKVPPIKRAAGRGPRERARELNNGNYNAAAEIYDVTRWTRARQRERNGNTRRRGKNHDADFSDSPSVAYLSSDTRATVRSRLFGIRERGHALPIANAFVAFCRCSPEDVDATLRVPRLRFSFSAGRFCINEGNPLVNLFVL